MGAYYRPIGAGTTAGYDGVLPVGGYHLHGMAIFDIFYDSSASSGNGWLRGWVGLVKREPFGPGEGPLRCNTRPLVTCCRTG